MDLFVKSVIAVVGAFVVVVAAGAVILWILAPHDDE